MSTQDPQRQRIQCSAKSLRQTRKSREHKELRFHGVEDGLRGAHPRSIGRRGNRTTASVPVRALEATAIDP